jgi:RNA polymerase sigma factor (sigma-70 family)
MIDDAELLRRYAEEHSEDAFTELVQRHVNLVYFAALRRVGGDAHLADDVAQRVFTDLARKASSLKRRRVIAGWLYTSTRFAAAQSVRSEQRRRTHEQEAFTMNEIDNTPETDWNQIRPVIDDAMDTLNERDREAVLLRFFENRPLADVGARFSLSPDAARMRVDRAMERLRRALSGRGITSTSAALAAAVVTQSGIAAPAGLVAKIVPGILTQAGSATTATIALWKVLSGIVIASLGTGMVVYETRQPSPAAAPFVAKSDVGAADGARIAPAVFPVRSQDEAPVATARTTASPARSHRTTDEFGWPQVGLFASDAGERPRHTIAEFRAKMKDDPEFNAAVVGQAWDNLDLFYGHLFKTLALSGPRLDQFKDLLLEKERLKIDSIEALQAEGYQVPEPRDVLRQTTDRGQEDLDAGIKTLLGDSLNSQYLQYREDLVQWLAVNAVTQKLQVISTPLTEDQASRLVVLLRGSLRRLRYPFTFDIARGAGVFPARIGIALRQHDFEKAAEFLSPPQVDALRQLQRPPAPQTQ